MSNSYNEACQTSLLYAFIRFFFWTWQRTTPNSSPIVLNLLTNRNFPLIYSVTICDQSQKIVHGVGAPTINYSSVDFISDTCQLSQQVSSCKLKRCFLSSGAGMLSYSYKSTCRMYLTPVATFRYLFFSRHLLLFYFSLPDHFSY